MEQPVHISNGNNTNSAHRQCINVNSLRQINDQQHRVSRLHEYLYCATCPWVTFIINRSSTERHNTAFRCTIYYVPRPQFD